MMTGPVSPPPSYDDLLAGLVEQIIALAAAQMTDLASRQELFDEDWRRIESLNRLCERLKAWLDLGMVGDMRINLSTLSRVEDARLTRQDSVAVNQAYADILTLASRDLAALPPIVCVAILQRVSQSPHPALRNLAWDTLQRDRPEIRGGADVFAAWKAILDRLAPSMQAREDYLAGVGPELLERVEQHIDQANRILQPQRERPDRLAGSWLRMARSHFEQARVEAGQACLPAGTAEKLTMLERDLVYQGQQFRESWQRRRSRAAIQRKVYRLRCLAKASRLAEKHLENRPDLKCEPDQRQKELPNSPPATGTAASEAAETERQRLSAEAQAQQSQDLVTEQELERQNNAAVSDPRPKPVASPSVVILADGSPVPAEAETATPQASVSAQNPERHTDAVKEQVKNLMKCVDAERAQGTLASWERAVTILTQAHQTAQRANDWKGTALVYEYLMNLRKDLNWANALYQQIGTQLSAGRLTEAQSLGNELKRRGLTGKDAPGDLDTLLYNGAFQLALSRFQAAYRKWDKTLAKAYLAPLLAEMKIQYHEMRAIFPHLSLEQQSQMTKSYETIMQCDKEMKHR